MAALPTSTDAPHASAAAVRLTVNGSPVQVSAPGATPLAYVLRNDLGLRGVRVGCASGQCGACTVLAGGAAVRSCVLPLEATAGVPVVTPEGLDGHGQGQVRQAFLAEQAAQCGYCINGIMMTVAACADAALDGRAGLEERVAAALPGHLCRCGTHVRILRAVQRLAGPTAPGSACPERSAKPADLAEPLNVQAGGVPDAGAPQGGAPVTAPSALRKDPQVESWIGVGPDGRIEARSGKAELGQGLRTALAQIVAGQLGMSAAQVAVRSASTDGTPDERYTAGTRSIEEGGAALAVAAAAFRRLAIERAAAMTGHLPGELTAAGDGVAGPAGLVVSWTQLTAREPLTGLVGEQDAPRWAGGPVGDPAPRDDLAAKLGGGPAFVHDLSLPGMLHARLVLPPQAGAALLRFDGARARAMAGVWEIVRDGQILMVIARREEQAVAAAERLARDCRWSDPGLAWTGDIGEVLRALPAETLTVRDDDGVDRALAASRFRLAASYGRPYHAHAAVAPSCAVAVQRDGQLTVWTHSQGVYPLRAELAALLDLPPARITVRHADGPGCYGHNGADDAAAFAAIAARAVPGTPVRLLYSLNDEMTWEPYGPAMVADLEAGVSASGKLTAWRHRARTDVHAARPTGRGDRLAAAWLSAAPRRRPWPGPNDTGTRDVVPVYDIPAVSAATDFVHGPLRTSALRSLASFHNVFASESFMDELAEAAGCDAAEFRLANLTDERARRVLEVALERCERIARVGPSGRGLGIGVSRYKGTKAYVAAVATAEADPATGEPAITSLLLVCDAGLIINPDGLRNQMEGGALQALSRTMIEEVRPVVTGRQDWDSYPVLRFGQVPEVSTVLINRPDCPPLGAGEAAGPPVAAAIANAIDDAIGVRLRQMPFTRDRIEQRLASLTAAEERRCLL